MLDIIITNKFKQDLKRIKKRNIDISPLTEVINLLANGQTLDEKYKNHNLIGDYYGHQECHIKPDCLLIYKIDNNKLILTLVRTGSHSDLF